MKLQFVAKNKARNVSYKKRKVGLFKKAQVLNILCDIDVCLIIQHPNDPTPEVFPNPNEAAKILQRYKKLPEYERSYRRFELESFLRHEQGKKIKKMKKEMAKEITAYKQLYFELLFFGFLHGDYSLEDLAFEDITGLLLLTEINISKIDARLEIRRAQEMNFGVWEGGFSLLMEEVPTLTFPDIDFRCKEELGTYSLMNYGGVEPYFSFY